MEKMFRQQPPLTPEKHKAGELPARAIALHDLEFICKRVKR
jgi:hypothetical protein